MCQEPIAQIRILKELGIQGNVRSNPDVSLFSGNYSKNTSLENIVVKKKRFLTQGIGIQSNLKESQYAFVLDKNKVGPFSSLNFKKFLDLKFNIPVYLDSQFIIVNYNKEKFLKSPVIFKSFELNKKGELILTDKKIKDSQKGVFGEIMKNSMGFFSKNKKSFSLPARIFQPKTNLEKLSEFFGNLKYIHKALESKNPIDKFKNVITFIISNFYYGLGMRKPLNPYLGETLQGKFPDESLFYAERISHNPPIDSFLIINELKNFRIHGKFESVTKMKVNKILINFKGLITIELEGEKLYAKLANVNNSGVIYGKTKLKLNDNFYFYYPNENLKSLIEIGDNKHNNYDQLIGGIYKNSVKIQNYINFENEIFTNLNQEKRICRISGSWVNSILWDGIEFWNCKLKCYKMHMILDVLPSDWRFREDLLWIAYGFYQYADLWKKELELLYRKDRLKRLEYKNKLQI